MKNDTSVGNKKKYAEQLKKEKNNFENMMDHMIEKSKEKEKN